MQVLKTLFCFCLYFSVLLEIKYILSFHFIFVVVYLPLSPFFKMTLHSMSEIKKDIILSFPVLPIPTVFNFPPGFSFPTQFSYCGFVRDTWSQYKFSDGHSLEKSEKCFLLSSLWKTCCPWLWKPCLIICAFSLVSHSHRFVYLFCTCPLPLAGYKMFY